MVNGFVISIILLSPLLTDSWNALERLRTSIHHTKT